MWPIRPLGDRKVGALRPIDLDLLYSELGGRGLSVRTVRICHTVLRQSLEQALQEVEDGRRLSLTVEVLGGAGHPAGDLRRAAATAALDADDDETGDGEDENQGDDHGDDDGCHEQCLQKGGK